MTELELKINTANAATSIQDIRRQIKALDSEAIKVGNGGQGFDKLTQASANLKEKINDLQDATNSLRGSGVERLNSSFGLLRQGFAEANTEKIGTAFKGLGAAMSAIPIFLLIEGLKLLWDNIDKVTGFLNGSTAALANAQKQFEATTASAKTHSAVLEDEISLLEAQGASESKVLKIRKEKLKSDLEAAEASYRLNTVKLLDIQSNDSLYESYLRIKIGIQKFLGQTQAAEINEKVLAINKAERAKEFTKGQTEALDAINHIRAQFNIAQAKFDTDQNKEHKKALDDKAKADLDYYNASADALNKSIDVSEAAQKSLVLKTKDLFKQAEIALAETEQEKLRIKAEADIKELEALYEKSKIEGEASTIAQQALAEGKMAIQLKYTSDVAEINKKAAEEKKKLDEEAAKKHKEQKQKEINNDIAAAQQFSTSTQKIFDGYYTAQLNKAKGNAKEENEIKKKQFQTNKAFAIVNATINGAQGISKIWATYADVPILAAALTVVEGAAVIAQIAAINSTQFTGTETGGTGSQSVASGGGSLASSNQLTATNTNGTTFQQSTVGNTGQQQSNTFSGNQGILPTQRVFVLESDITNTQGTIAGIEQSNSF